MLIGQASVNLSANILSALLGLLSVFIFTRLFSPHDYGVYLLRSGRMCVAGLNDRNVSYVVSAIAEVVGA